MYQLAVVEVDVEVEVVVEDGMRRSREGLCGESEAEVEEDYLIRHQSGCVCRVLWMLDIGYMLGRLSV